MVNRPPFFDSWAASLHHEDNKSSITYTFHFTAKPRFLRFFLDPLMGIVFDFELRPGHTLYAPTG